MGGQLADIRQQAAEELLQQAELEGVLDIDAGDDGDEVVLDREAALRALHLEDDDDQPAWREAS